jgi:membrane protein YqaA with SNARE-associated domain
MAHAPDPQGSAVIPPEPAATVAVAQPTPAQEVRTWRSLSGTILAVGLLAGLSALFLYFPIDYHQLGRLPSWWGYLGVAAVVFIATASFVLPIPYLLIVARAGTFLNPWLLGLTAGVAGMLGEMTGYLVGISGSNLIARGKWYERARGWVCDYGFWCIAFFACVPNPFFDAIGFAAGVVRYSVWRFALACFIGKSVKFLIAALVGEQAHAFGWLD